MNNLTFGDSKFGYYETIGGGCGAGPSWNGSSAVQCHMTNTRITDPEIMERRYPVRLSQCATFGKSLTIFKLSQIILKEFGIREGSGGKGQFSGGDGIVREIQFRRPVTVRHLCF